MDDFVKYILEHVWVKTICLKVIIAAFESMPCKSVTIYKLFSANSLKFCFS